MTILMLDLLRGDLAGLPADGEVVGLHTRCPRAGHACIDVDDRDLGPDLGHHRLLPLDARGIDDEDVATLGDHRLHLVHLDDWVFVRALEQQLEPLLLCDPFRLHLHSREVRCLELLLGEADHDVVDVALDPVCRPDRGLRRRVNLPAPG
jgi:hypothetical protein